MIKELKPNKYRNFKQTIIVKNQVDTVNGKLMINENTEATTRASYTFSIESSVSSWDTVKQRNIAKDVGVAGNSHEMAKSIVGCGMITLTHDFELDTPIVANASVNLSLAGKTYKLASNTHDWGDGNYDDVASAADFIINHSQHTESTWSTHSEYVSYDLGKVPMFAWVKDASYLIDYNYVNGWHLNGMNYELDADVAANVPPPSNTLTTWLKSISTSQSSSGFKASNGESGTGIQTNTGYWTQNGEKVRDKMMYPSPMPQYMVNITNVGNMPVWAYALSISFKPSYKYIETSVKKLDAAGYQWRVTITIPRFYLYLAICRAAELHVAGILNFHNGAADCPSLGFIDYIESAQVDLVGEVFDESSEEFSQQLDTNGSPIEGRGNYIQRLSNNELLTKGTTVSNLFDGDTKWRLLSSFGGTLDATAIASDGCSYYIHKFGLIDKSLAEYQVIKKNLDLGVLRVELVPGTNSTLNPGYVYDASLVIHENYSPILAGLELTILGTGYAPANTTYTIRLYGYAEGHVTGYWKDYATKLLINNFLRGKMVINCEVEASYIIENGGLNINDLIKFKDLYNRWITRNNRVIYFQIKNIRKVFENSKYVYQLTLIESNYGEQQIGSIRLFDYTDYTTFTDNFYGDKYLTFMPKRVANDGYFVRYQRGYNLTINNSSLTNQYMRFTFVNYVDEQPLWIDDINIDAGEAVFTITDIGISRVDANRATMSVDYELDPTSEAIDQFTVNSFNITYAWPSGQTQHPDPYLVENTDIYSVACYGKAITTNNITTSDNGYIKIDDYDEFNDCIVYIVRCPTWAFTNFQQIDITKTIPYEPMGGAGFFVRNDNTVNDAFLYGTRGHPDSGAGTALVDSNNEYLATRDNALLEVENEVVINYTGLYMIAVLKPNGAQISNGIIPFIKGRSNVNPLKKDLTYGQGQYYHIKGASFEDLDVLWDLIDASGELNNYHGKIYPLPDISEW